jgi:Asp-tRNA(Asn)/Glu-tRNA(Gln) amidotransferase A subunit family amidase
MKNDPLVTQLENPFRRLSLILLAALMVTVCGGPLVAETFRLETATIADMNAAFEAGALTSERLVQLYLNRIEAYDQQGAELNSIITLNPKALERARELDAERRRSGPRSLLHGIPIAVKDLFDTHDLPTSGGFLPMAKSQPWRDAFVVDKLRKAGAIILAKLNQNDWFAVANWGASTVAGQVQNPYKLGYVPGGSSSGTGVAMGAYFAAAGLGSETGVSIRNPTSDSVVAGFDPEDLYTQESIGKIPEEGYTAFVDADGLKGARIGVLRDLFSSSPEETEGVALIEAAVADIKAQRATVIDPISTGLDLFALINSVGVKNFEKKMTSNLYFDRVGPGSVFRTMGELVEKHPDMIPPVLVERNKVGELDHNLEYATQLKSRRMIKEMMIDLMDKYELDALVYPFKTLPAKKIGEGWSWKTAYNPLSSATGLPAMVAPAGFTREGLPIAVEFLGRPFSEPTLIRLASGYEAVTGHRKTPPATPPLPGEVLNY